MKTIALILLLALTGCASDMMNVLADRAAESRRQLAYACEDYAHALDLVVARYCCEHPDKCTEDDWCDQPLDWHMPKTHPECRP